MLGMAICHRRYSDMIGELRRCYRASERALDAHATRDRGRVNIDVQVPFNDGERAARQGDAATARGCFLEAGRAAVDFQLWRAAIRCYRHVLELDLRDREPLDRIARMPSRVTMGQGWEDYGKALDRHPEWPRFGCRTAHTVMSD